MRTDMLEKIFNCEGCRRRREKMKQLAALSKERIAQVIGKATAVVAEKPAPVAPKGEEKAVSSLKSDDSSDKGAKNGR